MFAMKFNIYVNSQTEGLSY